MIVASRLSEQKLLIILDDLWEETVRQEVLVPSKGVKYLVTSQMRDIHMPAEKLQIRKPTEKEASRIMANYTDGLPQRGEFPRHIQIVIHDIIEKLEYHPLSLANIGIGINRSGATDKSQWDVIQENLYAHPHENDFRTPSAYDRPYNLPVSKSMMLMVDSLPIEKRRLLFLLALLRSQSLPEPLVKYFYRFFEPRNFGAKYNTHERFLEDKSLLELRVVQGMGTMLDCHSLRSHYIRETGALELRSLGSEILVASGAQDVTQPIAVGDTEGTLATVLSSILLRTIFQDLVASTLGNHVKVINAGVIPRSLNMRADTMDFVKSARLHAIGNLVKSVGLHGIGDLVWLLKSDHEGGSWKQQAHHYAKKIIIKFVCQGKWDDHSMASLLRLPQATSVACSALFGMSLWYHHGDFWLHDISFSSAYSEITQTLFGLLRTEISIEGRLDVMGCLLYVIDFESKDFVFKVAKNYKAFLAMDSNPSFQARIIRLLGFVGFTGRGVPTLVEFPGLLEDLMALLLFGKERKVRLHAAHRITRLSRLSRGVSLRVAVFPDALQMLFDLFISEAMFVSDYYSYFHEFVGQILLYLSIVPESRIKVREIQGIWEGLGSILAELEGAWRDEHNNDRRRKIKQRASVAAAIFGCLGLDKDFRDTIASLPGVGEV